MTPILLLFRNWHTELLHQNIKFPSIWIQSSILSVYGILNLDPEITLYLFNGACTPLRFFRHPSPRPFPTSQLPWATKSHVCTIWCHPSGLAPALLLAKIEINLILSVLYMYVWRTYKSPWSCKRPLMTVSLTALKTIITLSASVAQVKCIKICLLWFSTTD